METKGILAELDTEIRRLEQVRAILAGKDGRPGTTAVAPARKKRRLSPEARARIAAAQKARWAKTKRTTK